MIQAGSHLQFAIRAPQSNYHPAWNLIPLLAGILDPILGVLAKVGTIFWRPELPVSACSSRRRRRGFTLIVGGIEGPSIYNYSMALGVIRSGYRGAVVRFPWNAGIFGLRSLKNLMSTSHLEHQSDLLATAITDHVRQYPRSPVCLLAQSGGCWVTIRALEKLPGDVSVRAAVLLAASVSAAYDIKLAVSRCRAGLLSIGSPGDFFFLGLGTTLLGTSDRAFSPAAGFVGWHHHPPGFVEARWHPSWARSGYWGNHISTSAPRFIQSVIAPLFKGP